MASRKRSISRSVACSLAALLLLSGCMFMVSTFQADGEEWVLVEDQVFDDYGLYCGIPANVSETDAAEYTFAFDEDTSVYSFEVTGGNKTSTGKNNMYCFAPMEGFDFSKQYKIVVSSENALTSIGYFSGTVERTLFSLKNVSADDEGVYIASIILLDQLVTDMSYQDCVGINCQSATASATFDANTFTFEVYELQTDNTGSIAAGITGLIMIVCGVFAMPMHNILRRR